MLPLHSHQYVLARRIDPKPSSRRSHILAEYDGGKVKVFSNQFPIGQTFPKALTIAGVDSGGGAGIAADLKTFAALGVHGMSAVTSVTAQNTQTVTAIHDLPATMVKAQIEAVIEDIGVDAAKTGMLHTSEIIEAVAYEIRKYGFPTVVDPVMVAKSGATLLEPAAVKTLKNKLLPLAKVVTPNIPEAEVLSDLKIKSLREAADAAMKISRNGPAAVVIKGGHLQEDVSVDLLYMDGELRRFEADRVNTDTTHGTGCSFSAAITAELAKGKDIPEAVESAKRLITDAVRFGLKIGGGHGPVNPMASIYREAERYSILENISEALRMLEVDPNFHILIPESQTNLAMALTFARGLEDVAAIPGRIVNLGGKAHASAPPRFGASRHVAATLMTARKHNSLVRAAMNIKFSEEILKICEKLGLSTSSYDRAREPPEIKIVEGRSTSWGAEEAIKAAGKVPDIIYHRGDWGKEPMATILAGTAVEAAKIALDLAAEYAKTIPKKS
ncbi:bifunctional hydroxymethylpyrimidine kinase/phosphomethylpyrimidine kinase [Candidatus Bathyarchaeota archaeon]|nr:bifunctional hydroxymethylpyrimidine kinase/phosphomethylpyrimidine kinase [Candidatus Bathyarchaeota archaeon]